MNRRRFIRYGLAVPFCAGLPKLIYANAFYWPLDLNGSFTQGGLVMGATVPGTQLQLMDRHIPVEDDGRFLLGFGRDQPPHAILAIHTLDGDDFIQEHSITQRTYDIQRVDGLPQGTVIPDPAAELRIAADWR